MAFTLEGFLKRITAPFSHATTDTQPKVEKTEFDINSAITAIYDNDLNQSIAAINYLKETALLNLEKQPAITEHAITKLIDAYQRPHHAPSIIKATIMYALSTIRLKCKNPDVNKAILPCLQLSLASDVDVSTKQGAVRGLKATGTETPYQNENTLRELKACHSFYKNETPAEEIELLLQRIDAAINSYKLPVVQLQANL